MEKLLPQNIEAECGVLGSIIIDPEAIVQVSDFLHPDDFYRDAHRTIYEVILHLFEQRQPADFITICDELERRNKLEEVGGPAYITSLINQVPTSGNIEYYGRIVERKAILRRLIHAAGQIAAVAYESDDSDAALEKAEQLIFSISQRHARADFSHISDILDEYRDKLEQLHERRGSIIGVPTGFTDLDRLTGGLQKSDLLILAARPGVGKTSLALSLAHNAAVKFQRSIAIFSLEMSKEQLVQRLLSMDASIDQQRLRTGWIEDDEWDRIVYAMDTLAEANIWIDDTAGISTTEMRSKARRLQAEQGVDMIIVDYLQLMQATIGGRRNENRVQEISEISRSLKGLARELNVPILALAQLSRAVESRQSKVPQLSDLRESGCLTGDTLVYLPTSGNYKPIEQLVGQSGFKVLALNTETWKLEPREVTHAFATGHKPVFKMTTRLGRTIRATANHKFLTIRGWERLDNLSPNTRIALPWGENVGTRFIASTPSTQDTIGNAVGTRFIASTPSLYNTQVDVNQIDRDYVGTQFITSTQVIVHDRQDAMNRVPTGDVYWDEITSIEPDGEADVYDLTVEGLHNFVAGDMIVHNSIEQDADIVMFIYRDDVYNPDSEKKNIADIIVAKHRNGPLGDISLYFQASQTRFRDLEVNQVPEE
ncbi:MAG TPA: replicative DNA helicase [Ktedonobacteraceae bacterium]|nr:replicative DNA helicase [Ktedonobacteraceae bacterium]